jgi:predicted metal-dependent phosphoesterase TrpH
MYKIDMHVHTAEVSACGRVHAHEAVKLYKKAGYDAIVITDHYTKAFFDDLGQLDWEEKVESFLSGYQAALEAGSEIGLNVLLGMELRFQDSFNDYLVYGIDEGFLKENPELYDLDLEQFHGLIQGKGILIYQAHPYRPACSVANPALLDGVEVFNALTPHSLNRLAYAFAGRNHLYMISGSDFHRAEGVGLGGIILPDRITTSKELASILRENENIGLIGL